MGKYYREILSTCYDPGRRKMGKYYREIFLPTGYDPGCRKMGKYIIFVRFQSNFYLKIYVFDISTLNNLKTSNKLF
jgi:hypothetical protein